MASDPHSVESGSRLSGDVLSALLANEAPASLTADDLSCLAAVKARVFAALEHTPQDDPSCESPKVITTSVEEGRWRPYLPGVERKTLLRRGDDVSVLLRMSAGSSLPAHGHPAGEHCVVISGHLLLTNTGEHIKAGAFHWVSQDTSHDTIVAVEESLIYLRGALDLA